MLPATTRSPSRPDRRPTHARAWAWRSSASRTGRRGAATALRTSPTSGARAAATRSPWCRRGGTCPGDDRRPAGGTPSPRTRCCRRRRGPARPRPGVTNSMTITPRTTASFVGVVYTTNGRLTRARPPARKPRRASGSRAQGGTRLARGGRRTRPRCARGPSVIISMVCPSSGRVRGVVARHDLSTMSSLPSGAIASRTRARIASACGARPVVERRATAGTRLRPRAPSRRSRRPDLAAVGEASPAPADGCATVRGRSNSTPCSSGLRRSTSASSVPLPPPTSTTRPTPRSRTPRPPPAGSPALMSVMHARRTRRRRPGAPRGTRTRAAVRERHRAGARLDRATERGITARTIAWDGRGSPAAVAERRERPALRAGARAARARRARAAAGAASLVRARGGRELRARSRTVQQPRPDAVVRGDAKHLRRRGALPHASRTCTGAGSVGAVWRDGHRSAPPDRVCRRYVAPSARYIRETPTQWTARSPVAARRVASSVRDRTPSLL